MPDFDASFFKEILATLGSVGAIGWYILVARNKGKALDKTAQSIDRDLPGRKEQSEISHIDRLERRERRAEDMREIYRAREERCLQRLAVALAKVAELEGKLDGQASAIALLQRAAERRDGEIETLQNAVKELGAALTAAIGRKGV